MATFAISITFTCTAKNADKAAALAEQIGSYVQQEKMATEYATIDIEELDSDEVVEELDFESDEDD